MGGFHDAGFGAPADWWVRRLEISSESRQRMGEQGGKQCKVTDFGEVQGQIEGRKGQETQKREEKRGSTLTRSQCSRQREQTGCTKFRSARLPPWRG